MRSQAAALLKSGKTDQPIVLHLNCLGGDVLSGRKLLQTMDDIKKQGLTIEVYADCAMSFAILFLANGSRGHRFVSPLGEYMIHESRIPEISGSSLPRYELEFRALADYLRGNNSLVRDTIIANSNGKLDASTLKEKTHNGSDWYLTPQEVVQYGLADDIRTPAIEPKA
ncbi:MAG: ATP-dependent Clp protease proteolytic subunit [Vampirovibrionales bacterium]|nr:ATP-dependent Clp protease proteolytic subunit [Vampirovibrionales bacterium]